MNPPRVGWWATHKNEFHKRRCGSAHGEPGDFHGWIGWTNLKKLMDEVDQDTRDLATVLFFTGARANEALLLKGDYFRVYDQAIAVNGAPCFKKQAGHHWQPDPFLEHPLPKLQTMKYRYYLINRQEPLTDLLVDVIERQRRDKLFFTYKYGTLYRRVANIRRESGEKHGPWWPHRFRAERASQLAEDYAASTHMLKDYFAWTRDATPNFYVHLSRRAWKKAYGLSEVEFTADPRATMTFHDRLDELSSQWRKEVKS